MIRKVLALIMAVAMIATLAAVVGADEVNTDELNEAIPNPADPPATPSEPIYRFVRVDENFGKWSGSGTVSARIDTAPWRFERLDRVLFPYGVDNAPVYDRVAGANFDIKEGRTIITLSENYLKTLTKGTHWFEAEFWVDDKGSIREIAENILLEIPSSPVDAQPAATTAAATAAPAAGGAAAGAAAGTTGVPRGGVALAIIPTFLAAGVALAASKKRK